MDNNCSSSSEDLIVKPDATSAELDELMKTGNIEIKKAIASHPNTSPETLIKLCKDYSDFSFTGYSQEVLKNPALSLILLENSDFLDRILYESDLVLNSITKFPKFIIKWSVNHPHRAVRSQIAGNHYIPIECLNKLAKDLEYLVRVSVAGTVCMSERDFEWLFGRTAKDRTVNYHPDLALKILYQLAEDKNHNVRYAVARNTGTPVHILEQLSFDLHPHVRSSIAGNQQTPEKVLIRLFQSEYKSLTEYKPVAESVARNKNIPYDLMEICAASDDDRLRYFIAGNSSATKNVLTKLACDKNRNIRQQVANNSNTSSQIIEQLAKEGIEKTDIPF